MIYIYEGILSSGVSLVQLGEEQFGEEGINFGFTLDGTKDSCKFEVLSFRRESVKPFSVVYHNETNSWWIVQKDKVERYTNEQGWIYKHSLQCIGAIELLNARDLTNCGFNQNKYTLQEFIGRLFKLSNFEFNDLGNNLFIDYPNANIDLDQKVDYIKTFENYTLLSALRELLDGYNQCVKLIFLRNTTYNQIMGCVLDIKPKTGDISLQVLNMDSDFNNVQEQRNMDKNSYGTIVVSNVDNAVSSETKIYPNVGGVKLSANEYDVTPENAIIRLPSNAFLVQEVNVCTMLRLGLSYYNGTTQTWDSGNSVTIISSKHSVSNDENIRIMLEEAKNYIVNNENTYLKTYFDETYFDSNIENFVKKIYNGGTICFKQGAIYNPTNNTFTFKDNSYNIKELFLWHIPLVVAGVPIFYVGQVVLLDEDTAKATHNPWNCITWKRGSDEIGGFGWIHDDKYSREGNGNVGGECYIPASQTIDGEETCVLYEWDYGSTETSTTKVRIQIRYEEINAYIDYANNIRTGNKNALRVDNFNSLQTNYALIKAKYIPMTDLKVKLDNNEENKHTHLYNQNGKLTDTLAFSKLINSYKTEIESENIVKYHTCYELFTLGTSTFKTISCPKLGQIVLDSNNEQYIINSVSYNLYQSEPNEYAEDNITYAQYYIECEYTLSKNVATKSLMVNPNTNIRDYGIPQKYNVRRTDLFRDFWEIDHSNTPHLDLPHQPLSKVLNIGNTPKTYNEHTAIMQIAYTHEINGSDKYYYQLESTTYMFKKSIFEVVEFKDNNIIGYDVQNIYSGFNITKLLTGLYNLHTTPISYTDENGEFKGIVIYMCNAEQMANIYEDYKEWLSYQDPPVTTDLPIQDMMIFIPYEIFNIAGSYNDYQMTYYDETDDFDNYYKDALEVPVFEYACQLDDTNDVIIGENILTNKSDDKFYLYSYYLVQKGVINNNNWSSLAIEKVNVVSSGASISNACKMVYNSNKIDVSLHTYETLNETTGNMSYGTKVSLSSISDYDIVVVRHTITDITDTYEDEQENLYQRTTNDLMFVIRHTENANIEDDTLSLSLNSYRLD